MKKNGAMAPTGVPGLDEVLKGGLPQNRLYLLRGEPGVGKTTLAMQFLLAGEDRGEHGLYITLSETAEEIRDIAESHAWDLGRLAIFELSALEQELAQEAQNTIFHPSEIELNRTTDQLLKVINQTKPKRLVLDSLSELRLLSDTALRYRRQMLSFKQFFAGRDITVLLLDDHSVGEGDLHVQSIAHGVISIDTVGSEYGAERRRIKVNKLRGVNFVGGYHDAIIVPGGLRVFPRLIAAEHNTGFAPGFLQSGISQLDTLLGGGIDYGTSCLLLGPAGTGKSSLAAQFATRAAEHGQQVLMCLFEETKRTLTSRSESISLPIAKYIDSGAIAVRQVDPGELAPGQFVNFVTDAVDRQGTKVVVIDSLNGYMQAMPDVKFLTVQLHELLSFLNHRGVVALMTVTQHGILGSGMAAPVDLTYLADTVLMLRYFEQGGAIKKAISVLKKRVGQHESSIRELRIDSQGIRVGDSLSEFEGVLTGVPVYKGSGGAMLHDRDGD